VINGGRHACDQRRATRPTTYCSGRRVVGQANAEAHDRELEQDLSRCLHLSYLGGAEFLEFEEPGSVGAGAGLRALIAARRGLSRLR
jgi:hypothetical protein